MWGEEPQLTFPGLRAIHCKVSRLICLQTTPLHAWAKHFDLLGMATLPNVDLEKSGTRKIQVVLKDRFLFKACPEWVLPICLPWPSVYKVQTQHIARVSHMISMGLTTYPVGAVWYVHTSPDHSDGVLDGFKRGI